MNALDDFLAAVSAPLKFLASAPAGAAARTRLPAGALAARGRALLRGVHDARVRVDLQALCQELQSYETAAPEQRSASVERCRALVERLRRGGPDEPQRYQRSTGAPADHL